VRADRPTRMCECVLAVARSKFYRALFGESLSFSIPLPRGAIVAAAAAAAGADGGRVALSPNTEINSYGWRETHQQRQSSASPAS
jgi:hypothetical protein